MNDNSLKACPKTQDLVSITDDYFGIDYDFSNYLRCGICGEIFKKKQQKRNALYLCNPRYKQGKKGCSSKGVPDDKLVEAINSVLNLSAFDEAIFESQIKEIIVFDNNALDIHFLNGKVIKTSWKDRENKDNWTLERRAESRAKSMQYVNAEDYPLRDKLICGDCGNFYVHKKKAEGSIGNSEFVLALSKLSRWGNAKVADYVARHCYDLEECLNFLEIELTSSEFSVFNCNLFVAREELKSNELKHIKSISLFDPNFPKKLCESKDPVVHLYYAGDISLLQSKCITIIGTRKPTGEFVKKGYEVTKYFANRGYTIVSGLALGCDSIAHRTALEEYGKTIAILPSPIDNIVPTQNKGLADEIINSGGLLISEYSTDSLMNKFNYPQRDRIQSLLSNVAIVIQSEDDGGTMIAVKKSLKDGKKVFALQGNNLTLIKDYLDLSNDGQLIEIEKLL